MTKALIYLAMALLSTVGVMACGMAYLRHPQPTKAFGRAMVLIAALTWYAAFGGALAGAAHSPVTDATGVIEAEAPEPDPGQAWPPDPSLTRAVWVRPAGVAFHVTVGRLNQTFPQYHRNVTGDSRRVVTMGPDATPLAHVAGANSGTVGIALCCAWGSTYGPAPAFDLRGGLQPIARQVEDAAAVAAEGCIKWGLDPNGTRTLANGARVPVLATHRDYALAGGYGAWRFDPGGQFATQLRTKARWYFSTTKAGKRQAVWVR